MSVDDEMAAAVSFKSSAEKCLRFIKESLKRLIAEKERAEKDLDESKKIIEKIASRQRSENRSDR